MPPHHILRICHAEFCRAAGSAAIAGHAAHRLGISPGETTPDGRFALSPIYCLGNCSNAPSIMFDGKIHGRATPELAGLLIGNAAALIAAAALPADPAESRPARRK